MDTKPTNEFNIPAVASQETLLRLSTLIFHGGSVTSIFGAAAGTEKAAAAEQEARERHQAFINMVMATPEEMATFDLELARLDEASTAALLENEEKLREAQEEVDRIRERAFVMTMPDDRETKVYRDDDDVREEDGKLVEFMTADDLPADTAALSDLKAASDKYANVLEERKAIIKYREKIDAAQDRLEQGPVSEDELEAIKAGLDEVPEPVSAHLDENAAKTANDPANESTAAESTKGPSKEFATAAAVTMDDLVDLPPAAGPNEDSPINRASSPSTPALK